MRGSGTNAKLTDDEERGEDSCSGTCGQPRSSSFGPASCWAVDGLIAQLRPDRTFVNAVSSNQILIGQIRFWAAPRLNAPPTAPLGPHEHLHNQDTRSNHHRENLHPKWHGMVERRRPYGL